MPFSEEDKVLIKYLNLYKGYGPCRLMTEFPEKKLEEGRAWEVSQKTAGNRKHQPKAREQYTEARAHWGKCDIAGVASYNCT